MIQNNQTINLHLVEYVATELGPLIDEFILVGGCAAGLLITDSARPPIRQTIDVDLTAEILSLSSYYDLQEKLKSRGFTEDQEIICRWKKSGALVDVIPANDIGLGFSNRWYPLAIETASEVTLPNGTLIRVISAPAFVASKLESFYDRGDGDYGHHDMEDIVNIIDGRAELEKEIRQSDSSIREFISDEFDALLSDSKFTDQIAWHLRPERNEQQRTEMIINRMRSIAGL